MSSRQVFTPILIAASLVLLISFAIRASFGVFQIPIANDLGWFRTEFSLAIAIQNLAWGIATPLFGAFAEKLGDRKAVVVGVLVYALGLALSSMASTATSHQLLEILVGVGIAGTGFGVILGVVGRAASDETRSLALGITTAAGSAGQIVGPPLTQYLLNATTWQNVFLMYAGVILLALLALPFMKAPPRVSAQGLEQSLSKILNIAVRDPSYALIFVGFFSCGFQLAFVTAHFPAFVTEACATIDPNGILAKMGVRDTADLGAFSIAVIGIFNIIGTVTAGALGGRFSKRLLLASIYFARTLLFAWFILTPMTPVTVIIFSIFIGSLWLATVPLTSGLVAYIYGLKYMGTLYGLVFLSHQIGGFVGVWLGGDFYDRFGSYEIVWWVGVGTGLLSAIVHLPVREMPYQSREQAA
ncbi:MAG: MFS transporter [Litorivicinaceae bacterium]|nr:MAG: MFS transporter [Litorivicinaceae bacterium]